MSPVYGVPAVFFCLVWGTLAVRDRVALWRILRFRKAHNLLMSVYSGFIFVYALSKLYSTSLRELVCSARPGVFPFWTLSKFVEWMDTIFLLARYKRVGMLHLFHHATAPVITILNSRSLHLAPTPLYDVGTLLNAFVHFFMYAYYSDPELFRPLRKWITTTQIVQHAIIVILTSTCLALEQCDAPVEIYGTSMVAYGFYLALFANFYVTTYA